MDTRELQKLRPVREVVESQEHFTVVCHIEIKGENGLKISVC
ncbi:hypothetical protein [Ligilactobacillus murinus]|nr:hypothetical protein [Ligilactobacillus murinus]